MTLLLYCHYYSREYRSLNKREFSIFFVDPIVKVLFNYNASLSPGISVLEGDWVSPHQHIIIITLQYSRGEELHPETFHISQLLANSLLIGPCWMKRDILHHMFLRPLWKVKQKMSPSGPQVKIQAMEQYHFLIACKQKFIQVCFQQQFKYNHCALLQYRWR